MSFAQPILATPEDSVDLPLRGIRPNIVQSIRAFRVPDLQDAAKALGHHFLYANLANAQSKQDVLDLIGQQFMLTVSVGKNFDSLYDSLTDPVHKSGPQPGFIAVLEHIPANVKFDKEAREQLLDISATRPTTGVTAKYLSVVSTRSQWLGRLTRMTRTRARAPTRARLSC